jgi:hypothetical protein
MKIQAAFTLISGRRHAPSGQKDDESGLTREPRGIQLSFRFGDKDGVMHRHRSGNLAMEQSGNRAIGHRATS